MSREVEDLELSEALLPLPTENSFSRPRLVPPRWARRPQFPSLFSRLLAIHRKPFSATRPQAIALATIYISFILVFFELVYSYLLSREPKDLPPLSLPCAQDSPLHDLLRWQAQWQQNSLCHLSNPPPPRSFATTTIKHSATYIAFEESIAADSDSSTYQLQPVTPLPPYCLDSHLSYGSPCPFPISTTCPSTNQSSGNHIVSTDANSVRDSNDDNAQKLDVVWTWVNGSDPFLVNELQTVHEKYGYKSVPKLYRDHDELRHSMRSALQYLRNIIGRFRLLSTDLPITSTTSHPNLRIGLMPQWLNLSPTTSSSPTDFSVGEEFWQDGNVTLDIRFHSTFFQKGHYVGPVFNSFAIESQLGSLCNISENFIYMNDDFFIASELELADFYTPQYGPVIRFDYGLVIWPSDPSSQPPHGELRALEKSAYLLSQRFGYRGRPYIMHIPKLLSLPLVNEYSEGMFPSEFRDTAGRPLRGLNGIDGKPSVKGGDDVHPAYMFGNFVVERWREALLWSWVVGRIGGEGTLSPPWSLHDWESRSDVDDEGDDDTDEDEWIEGVHGKRAWHELGGTDGSNSIYVDISQRDTLDRRRVKQTIGVTNKMKTSYTFSSQDGYPFSFVYPNHPGRPPSMTRYPHSASSSPWDNLLGRNNVPPCEIKYDQCFGNGFQRASDVFVHVAFDDVGCGDCIIRALVASSGTLGLSAFLPDPSRIVFPDDDEDLEVAYEEDPPHLPLVSDFHDGDFSLRSVMADWIDHSPPEKGLNVRAWTMQLLQRYRFVVGELPWSFSMVTDPKSAKSIVKRLKKDKSLSMICINDDVVNGEKSVNKILTKFLKDRWRRPALWES